MGNFQRCSECGGMIAYTDESFPWGDGVVCRSCYARLAVGSPEPSISRPMQFGGLTIGPATMTVGSVTIPIHNISSVQAANVTESTERAGAVMLYMLVGIGLPLSMCFLPVWLERWLKHTSETTARTFLVVIVGVAAAVFLYCAVMVIRQLLGRRSSLALLITTNAGQQIRVDFRDGRVLQRALAAIRAAVGTRNPDVTFNTLIVGRGGAGPLSR